MTQRQGGFKQQILRFGLRFPPPFPDNRDAKGGDVADNGRNASEGYGLLAPTLVVMGLALAAPLALMAITSLKDQSGMGFAQGWTLDQYGAVLGRSSYRLLFLRSVAISAVVAVRQVTTFVVPGRD